MKKSLLIINTGGTIGMQPTESGFRPCHGFLESQMMQMPELNDQTMPDFTILEHEPLADSANFTPDHWRKIAWDIHDHYDQFDAFVVLHGTDTLAYTASALPFMLRGLDKTVILTGSQLPLCLRRNDARENLKTAMIIAAEYDIPEVCVYFGSRLLRGCRTTKVSTSNFDAFDSPNDPPLGVAGTRILIYEQRIRHKIADGSDQGIRVTDIAPAKISTFRLFPGVSVDVLENVLQTPLQGLVLETYGAGNGPSQNQDFLKSIRQATDRGVVVVNRSQCGHGSIAQDAYETGRALANAGVVSGFDITVEAAITKLMFLFSQCGPDPEPDTAITQRHTIQQIKARMTEDLVGEMTVT